jgi:hypothetical protein
MRSHEYFRLHATCLAMATQSANAEVQARWLAIAEIWLKRATEWHERSLSARGRSLYRQLCLTLQLSLPSKSPKLAPALHWARFRYAREKALALPRQARAFFGCE